MPDSSEGEGSPVGFAADGAVLPRGGRRRRNPSGGMAGDAARAGKARRRHTRGLVFRRHPQSPAKRRRGRQVSSNQAESPA